MTFREKAIEYLASTTAINAVATPAFTILENAIIGMPDELSTNARLVGAGLTYAGLGTLAFEGRVKYRQLLEITDSSSKAVQFWSDAAYVGLINLVMSPPFYYIAGSRDWAEIVRGTLAAVGVGVASGGFMGYAIDAAIDFAGIKESSRLPDFLKKQPAGMKKTILACTIAASIGLTSLIYHLTPDQPNAQKQQTEQSSQLAPGGQ